MAQRLWRWLSHPQNDVASRRRVLLLCLLAWVARLACVGVGRAFWDEIYQFVEPAVWQMTGMGVVTWEYQEGMRNWLLPVYYGGLLYVARAVGLGTLHTYLMLQVINTLWSLLMIPAVFRLGLAASRGRASVAWLAAVLTAFLAPLAFYGATLLSELPAMVLTTWAWALWYELMEGRAQGTARRTACWVGFLLSAAIVLRYSFVIAALPIALELLWRRQGRLIGWMSAGALPPVATLALADTMAWGTPWHSLWAYFQQNITQGKAAALFGAQTPSYYWNTMFRGHFRLGRILLLPWALLFARRHGRALFGCLLPLVIFSCIDHKEERFVCFTWPLILVACSHGLISALDFARDHLGALGLWLHHRRQPLVAAVAIAVIASSAWNLRFERRNADAYRAASWAGSQSDCTGFMTDAEESGGYFIFGRAVPLQRHWDAAALLLDDMTYIAAAESSHRGAVEGSGQYELLRYEGRFAMYRRSNTRSPL